MESEYIRIDREALTDFCSSIFHTLGLSDFDAQSAADVLVAADVRGIPSHGVGRLWRYVNGLETGLMRPDAPVEVIADTPYSSLRIMREYSFLRVLMTDMFHNNHLATQSSTPIGLLCHILIKVASG